ncbi:MAG: helix-turn-helix domain-containing protein [Prevotellaceae bacterium]|jgi:AraC-like DNA-binding protein|nr:helix-turn-helix domain-containing protein [Prevotellaceae bacterium]
MERKVTPLSWQTDISSQANRVSIDNDIILYDNFTSVGSPVFNFPFKFDMLFLVVCTKGNIIGTVDFRPYNLTAPCAIIIRPNQILHCEHVSEDFAGYCLVISQRLAPELLPLVDKQATILAAIKEYPYAQLYPEGMPFVKKYFFTLKKIMAMTDSPYRLEMIKHLTMLFFYTTYSFFQKRIDTTQQTRQGLLVERFTNLVRENYRRERDTEFYADKLCLTTKYLSQVIKTATGKSAADWIADFVILEAKALLKSTNMTVQQISDELNFPSQSFFGKYFKRIVGMSPKEYRGSKTQ